MKKIVLTTLAALIAVAVIAPAQALAWQRGSRPNVAIVPPAVVLALPGFFGWPPAPRHGPAFNCPPARPYPPAYRPGFRPGYGPYEPRRHWDRDRYSWDRPHRRW